VVECRLPVVLTGLGSITPVTGKENEMSQRLVPATLAIASLALLGASSSTALASSAPSAAVGHALDVTPALAPAKIKTRKVHYQLKYTDEKFGPVLCKGVHITSAEFPGTATSGGADKFKCRSTTKKRLLFGEPGEVFPENFTEWQSDYFATLGESVLAKSLKATESASGKAYSGLAVYPSPEEEAQKAKEKEEREKAEKEQQEKEQKEKEEEELE
jgi:hypothetical protein